MSWVAKGGVQVQSAVVANSIAGTLSAPVAAGDLIIAAYSRDSSTGHDTLSDTFTDTLGNTYTRIDRAVDATHTQSVSWYYSIVTNPGTPGITATFFPGETHGSLSLVAKAFSGAAGASVLDGHLVNAAANTAGAGAGNATTLPLTPSLAGCLVVGLLAETSAQSAAAPGTGWTEDQDTGPTVALLELEHLVEPATAAHAASWSVTSGTIYLAFVAAFRPVAATVPVNTTLPSITGTARSGQTLTAAAGAWTNTPTGYLYQWRRGSPAVVSSSIPDGASLTGPITWTATVTGGQTPNRVDFLVDGVVRWSENTPPYQYNGDPGGVLDTTTLADGAHQLIARAVFLAGAPSVDAVSDVTVANGAPAPVPPFTPLRTVNVTTAAQFDAAVAALLPGDLVVVTGTITGQRTIGKRLTDWAVFDLTNAHFTGGTRAAGNFVGLYIRNAAKIRTLGGEFTNPGGDGIRVELGCSDIDIYDALVHNVGTQGILVQGNGAANLRIRLVRPECYACGNTAYDPHLIPGTGLHCVYFGGGPDFPSGGEIIDAYAHDQPYGCGIQIGSRVSSLSVTNPRIERITFGQGNNAGGNAFNIWDETKTVHNVVIDGAHGTDISGYVTLTNDFNSDPGSVLMQHARFTNVALTPHYMLAPGITYVDCA